MEARVNWLDSELLYISSDQAILAIVVQLGAGIHFHGWNLMQTVEGAEYHFVTILGSLS